MASLTGNLIADSYIGLLKTADNNTVSSTLKNVTDGLGNPTALSLSSTEVVISGSLTVSGSFEATSSQALTASYAVTAAYAMNGGGGGEIIFVKNRTTPGATTTITQYQSLFNPADLLVQSTSVFLVEQDAEYYVLGDFYNNASVIVSGTIHIDGGLYNSGSIVGPGIIE